jgi:hypothetical protein
MLNPNQDRLDYGAILSPPPGYSLDFAVGTTYSLDLDALVGACISLGLAEATDSELMKNPICLLEALRNTGDKVALFCEGGQIHLPGNVTSLYILLEKMVYQVATKAKKGITRFPSFHPKCWVIRYVNHEDKKDYCYRFVILSRNLTFDRSWDVSFYMDGNVGAETDKNEPLADFLLYLMKQMPKGDEENAKIRKMRTLIKELSYVTFDTGMKEFEDYEFLPNGIPVRQGGEYSMLDTPLIKGKGDTEEKSFHELLVMSPFLSNDIIRQFNERSQWIEQSTYVLITRAESLVRLKRDDCSNFDIYVLKDAVINGEQAISGEGNDYRKQDIHAKLYMLRKGRDSELYLGSMNASHNAVYGNVEFMIRLKSKNRYLNLDKLLDALFGGSEDGADNPFMQVDFDMVDGKETEEQGNLEVIIKELNRLESYAEVETAGEFYQQTVYFKPYEKKNEYQISLRPLLCKKQQPFSECMVFDKMTITELSEFYVLSVTGQDGNTTQRVIKIPTNGLPEEREQKIISSVIGDDPQNFYRYVAFLLGDNYVAGALDAEQIVGEGNTSGAKHSAEIAPALYEKMLQTAVNAPERFQEIERLVEAVSEDDVIPDGFEKLYNTFRKVVS